MSRLAASVSTDPGHVTSADSASLERRQVAMHDASADATLEFAQSVRYSFSCRLFLRLLLHAARVLGLPGAPAFPYGTGPDGQPLGDFTPGHRFSFCCQPLITVPKFWPTTSSSEGFPRPFTRSDSAFRVKGVERQARLSAFQAAGARSTGGSGTLASRPPGGLVGCSDLRKRSQEGGLQASVET